MFAAYFSILIFIVLGLFFGVAPLVIGSILGPRKKELNKLAPYECGFPEFSDARMKFDVKFYLISILFIIFDLEIAFLFPWGVAIKQLSWPAFNGMLIFLLILFIGFIYEWRKGALEWE